MYLNIKKYGIEYGSVFLLSIFSGLLVSFSNLSVFIALGFALFAIISFKYFDKVLLLLIFYLPFQAALNISSGVDLASGRVLILYLFGVWVIKSLAGKKININFSLQTILISLFVFIAIFSMLGAWDMERASRKILVFLSIFPLYFAIASMPKEGEQAFVRLLGRAVKNKNNYIHGILIALFASGFILSLIGIAQFLLQFFIGIDPLREFWSKVIAPIFYGETFGAEVVSNPSWLVNINSVTVMRAISLFPDPHMFSFYLGLLIPIALAFILYDCRTICLLDKRDREKNCLPYKKGWGGWDVIQNSKTLLFILAIMLLAELLTFSRGGYLGLIAGIGAVIILGWRYLSFYKKMFLGFVFFFFLAIILTTNLSIMNRFLSSFDFQEGSNTERIKNWSQGWELFSDNFFFGVGIGNYSYHINPTADYRTPIYAHNLYLDIAAEMGVFALITWVSLFAITIFQLFRLSRGTEDFYLRALSLGLIGSLSWFFAHGFFDTPIYSPTILAIFVVILSLSAVILEERGTEDKFEKYVRTIDKISDSYRIDLLRNSTAK